MNSALIIIDVQNDFLPGGALPVAKGDEIIQPINSTIEHFDWVLASKDWHPHKHVSFASTWGKKPGEEQLIRGKAQKLWPDHCVEKTFGSQFPSQLDTDSIHHTFCKGHNKQVDSYSVFFDQNGNPASALHTFLTVHQITDLYFCGLATNYCVMLSVLDALKLGYQCHVLTDCCRGIGANETERALDKMTQAGALLMDSSQVEARLSATSQS